MAKKPIAYYCKRYKKLKLGNSRENFQRTNPEHLSYKETDIREGDGEMIPVYELNEEEMKILDEYNNGKEIFIKQ